MASEDMGLVPSQRLENGLNPQLVFHDEPLRFNCSAPQRRVGGDPGPKTRELSGFMDEKMFSVDRDRYFQPQGAEYRRSMYGDAPDRRDCPESQNWNGNGRTPNTPSGDGSDEDEDDDDEEDDDEVDEGDGEVEGLVGVDDGNKKNNNNNSSGSVHSSADKIGNGKPKHHSSFGSNREMMMKDGNIVQSVNNTRASPGENHQQGRVGHYPNAVTIAEPDGEMYYSQFIHASEGSGPGQKDIVEEEELHFYRASKRRRERFEEKGNYGDSTLMDPPRGRGVQFPFSVTDRVIIKGNKRTPQRFVGREAVVTTQCLNGWYVVKTLDNAESVKLQYRSLAKVSDNPSSKPMSSKMTPNWL